MAVRRFPSNLPVNDGAASDLFVLPLMKTKSVPFRLPLPRISLLLARTVKCWNSCSITKVGRQSGALTVLNNFPASADVRGHDPEKDLVIPAIDPDGALGIRFPITHAEGVRNNARARLELGEDLRP